jgi:hypothetical protein
MHATVLRLCSDLSVVLMALCGAAVLTGLVLAVRWGALEYHQPDDGDVYRRFFRHVAIGMLTGVGAGLLVGGPGGRLVMRLLAATSGDDAQGRITEAEEIVGEITLDGTLGFIIFTGLFVGVFSGLLYAVVRRFIPAGRLGGLALGGLGLAIAATRLDPLRRDNPDFDIVGPSWVALVAFGALVMLHGMVVVAIAVRASQSVPLFSNERRALLTHAPLLLLAPVAPVAVVLIVAALVAGQIERRPEAAAWLRSRRALLAGRLVVAAVALAFFPGTVSALTDIAGRGP